MIKKLRLSIILFSVLFLLAACISDNTSKSESDKTVKRNIVLPDDIPKFVKESDFKEIDWEKKAVRFNGMLGNENKSGVIGADAPSLNTQKWMWHLWGINNPTKTNLTVVGYHKESGTAHKILTEGWTTSLAPPNNGADAHTPSNVKIPKPGEWAMLLYTDETLFDILVYDIEE